MSLRDGAFPSKQSPVKRPGTFDERIPFNGRLLRHRTARNDTEHWGDCFATNARNDIESRVHLRGWPRDCLRDKGFLSRETPYYVPTLNWIGKGAVVDHHKQVPFRLLKPIDKLSVGEDSGNLLVPGDNLEALKALLPYYAGQVKCIYIDPPYNTGKEGWVYNDTSTALKSKHGWARWWEAKQKIFIAMTNGFA